MPQENWIAVDRFVEETLLPPDATLAAVTQSAEAAGLPKIAVSPAQGKLLHLLAEMAGARRILEIGTLAGYSTIWLARALPAGGRLITLEVDPKHAAVSRANFTRTGLDNVIELRLGNAKDSLRQLVVEGADPFDLFFIDADKPNIPAYFEEALKLSHPGSVLVIDNVVREGALADASSQVPDVQGVRRLHELLAAEARKPKPRVTATTIQTVGVKGYDGFTLVRVSAV